MSLRPAWARFRSNRPAMFGLTLVAMTLAVAFVLPWLWPHAPDASHFELPSGPLGGPPPPSPSHPLGTDALHRDLVARVASGGSLSLSIAFAATALALVIGTLFGVVAGLSRETRFGWLDAAILRLIEVTLALPYLLVVTAIGVLLDRATPGTIALILGSTGWVGLARLVRGRTLELAASDHVLAAHALGVPLPLMVWRHIFPGLAGLLLVLGSQAIGQMVLAEAVLGYLTVGVGPPRASWGRMLQESEPYLGLHPLLVGAPAFAVVLTVFGFARVADGVAEALSPRGTPWRPSRIPIDLLFLGALVALVVGFSGPTALAPPLERRASNDRILRLATAHTVGALDPALAYDELTLGIDELVHARLFRVAADGTLEGDLAESIRSDDTGTRFEVRLREGVRFHDGKTVEARDVKRSLERALHPDTPCPSAAVYASIVGFEAYRSRASPQLEGIIVQDRRTLAFALTVPNAAFPASLTLGFAAPVCDDGRDHAEPTGAPPCGAGPFQLAHRDEGRIELVRFERGQGPRQPTLHGLTLELGIPVRTQRYRFERGELDVLTEVSGVDGQRFDADPRWRDQFGWGSRPSIEGVYLNTRVPPFDNRHVRRAVAFALDPDVLRRLRPGVAAIDRILLPGLPRPRDVAGRRHDLDAALEEMRLAGFPYDPSTGTGGYPGPIRYMTIAASFDQAASEVYLQQLARIGLRITIEPVTYPTWLATIGTSRAPAMGWRGWVPDFPDPAGVVDPLLLTSALAATPTQNASFFSNPVVDRLADEARREPRRARRLELYAAIEDIVRDEAPWIPVYTSRIFAAWHATVTGVRFNATGRIELAEVGLRDDGAPR
jgi:ABC-type dipeptide/oligopeptide/nickel transport system permease subunit/ABC-type transport system substrate-binding protein